MSVAPHPPQPPPPFQAYGLEGCPLCGAPLQGEQEWCLRCGAAARTRLASSPRWRGPLATVAVIAALALGVLAAALVTLAGGSGGAGSATTAPPANAALGTSTVPGTVPATTVPSTTAPGAGTTSTSGAGTPGSSTSGTSTPGATGGTGATGTNGTNGSSGAPGKVHLGKIHTTVGLSKKRLLEIGREVARKTNSK